MKINILDNILAYKPTVPLEIETCPFCFKHLDLDYSMTLQLFMFIFECLECRCDDSYISKYKVELWFDTSDTQDHKWFQNFFIKGLYIKTDLQNMTSEMYRLNGSVISDKIMINFILLGLDNRDTVLKKLSIYSTLS